MGESANNANNAIEREPMIESGQMYLAGLTPPLFVKEWPDMWFLQVEAQLRLGHITNDMTKYCYVVQSLTADVLKEVSDFITNPPAEGKYDGIKAAILREFEESATKRLNRLLNSMPLGEQRPSRLLRRMRYVGRGLSTETLLKHLWMQRLPTNMRMIIAASSEPLDTLARMADNIHEVMTDGTGNAHVSVVESENASLRAQITELSARLERLERLNMNQPTVGGEIPNNMSTPPLTQTSRTAPRTSSLTRPTNCWYHRIFGSEARKCSPPCAWIENL